MTDIMPFLTFGLGLALGAGAAYIILRARLVGQNQLLDSFKALAADTLHANSATFLQLAETKLQQAQQAANASLAEKATSIDEMVKPVKETLKKMDEQIHALEVKREGAYKELSEMVQASRQTQIQLRSETSQLLQALRTPSARGHWGEIQLQRLLEMTGMSEHAKDFSTQSTFANEDGAIRPDVIVALPGARTIVIDSKVPLTSYLNAVQAGEGDARDACLKQHARAVKEHVKKLAAKKYWEKVAGAPDFVVLFLPGEHFLSAALDGDEDLMEYSITQQVVLATPMTLIALLRTVAQSWRQEAVRQNAEEIGEIGRKLYASLMGFTKTMDTLGTKLGTAVEAYNKALTTFEGNVLGKAKAFEALGAAEAEGTLESASPIERTPRALKIVASNTED